MASDVKNTISRQVCSKDHELREKLSIEKYASRLKGSVKRIPATQKCIYSFGEIGNDITSDKEKRRNHVEDISRSSSVKCKTKSTKPNYYLKSHENSVQYKDPQLTEIEKQIKEIQSHKRELNQMIFKELRDAKSGWHELQNRTSFPNMRSVENQNNTLHMHKLYETLEKTTQQVETLNRSFSEFHDTKHNQVDNAYAHDRGDNNKVSKLENYTKMLKSSSIVDQVQKNDVQNYQNSDNTLENSFCNIPIENDSEQLSCNFKIETNKEVSKTNPDFEKMSKLSTGISTFPNLDNDFKTVCNNFQCHANPSTSFKIEEHYTISNQACTTAPTNYLNKYSTLNRMMPEIYKSEYLKKSCGFD